MKKNKKRVVKKRKNTPKRKYTPPKIKKGKTTNEDYVYHITDTLRMIQIKKSGGLVGSTGKLGDTREGSEKGYLYVVDCGKTNNPRYEWDFVPVYLGMSLESNRYVVLGIKKSYLSKNNIVIEDDSFCFSRKTHKQISLGDHRIPLSELEHFGEYQTISTYRWDLTYSFREFARDKGVSIDEVVRITDVGGYWCVHDWKTIKNLPLRKRVLFENNGFQMITKSSLEEMKTRRVKRNTDHSYKLAG